MRKSGVKGWLLGAPAASPKGEHEPDSQKNPQCKGYPDDLKKRRAQELAGGKSQLLAHPNPGTDIVNVQANRTVAGGPVGGQKAESNDEDADDDPQGIHNRSKK